MTSEGQRRLAEALLNMGRAFFELGAAIERLDEDETSPSMATMEREVVGKPIKNGNLRPDK